MKGMVIRMNAKDHGKNTEKKPHRVWGISFRTGLLGIMAASILLLGVACTRNGAEDGTVQDSNVGSVTSDATEKATHKETDMVSEKVTEKMTEARTHAASEPGTGAVTVPGTMPGTMPGTGEIPTPAVTEHQTSGVTVPGTGTPGTAKGRNGKG